MLYSEIIAVCSEIHTKHVTTLCGQNVELLNVKLVVHIVTTGVLGADKEKFIFLARFVKSLLIGTYLLHHSYPCTCNLSDLNNHTFMKRDICEYSDVLMAFNGTPESVRYCLQTGHDSFELYSI
jgi:hypothetical protein